MVNKQGTLSGPRKALVGWIVIIGLIVLVAVVTGVLSGCSKQDTQLTRADKEFIEKTTGISPSELEKMAEEGQRMAQQVIEQERGKETAKPTAPTELPSDKPSVVEIPALTKVAVWVRQFGSAGFAEALALGLDGAGNIYVTGYVAGSGSLPGQTSSGSSDAFVRKYDPSGTELWTRQFGSTRSDLAYAVAVDGAGNIYVAGWAMDFLPGQGYREGSGFGAFLRKYDPSGTELWTRQFGSTIEDAAKALGIDGIGNIYVAGRTYDRGTSFRDPFLRKYDPSGTELWTRQFGWSSHDEADAVTVDGTGNAYVVGWLQERGSGRGGTFLWKFDPLGKELWTRQLGDTTGFIAKSLAVEVSGNIYTAGLTLRKYDPSGVELWTRQVDSTAFGMANAVAVDTAGLIYVAGQFGVMRVAESEPEIAWGKRVSPEFKAKVIEICTRLRINVDYLMAAMAFETGRTFDPAITNSVSGATGLIQFLPSTALGLGTTTDALRRMSAVEQLNYVENYFAPYEGRLATLEDVYMAILWPKAIGQSDEYALFASPTTAYNQNRGLDLNGDGRVTKAEAAAKVRDSLAEGLSSQNKG